MLRHELQQQTGYEQKIRQLSSSGRPVETKKPVEAKPAAPVDQNVRMMKNREAARNSRQRKKIYS